ncbi:PREDICTED: nicotinamide N-methyltransferase-like [Nanorana parkeri]|uniref:nicotinamide N-methyltransferase-like n=1 Tax=Nanorana parkeri TaxID=125878 RepID=UPI00085442A1|nr:PREDICTED: nicotinamide N-methyltransferase-like [Nanorana parkeri]
MDASSGPIVHHLFQVSHLFKEITLLRVSERCIMELRKWLDSHSEAFDWSHISTVMADLQGPHDDWQEKEMQLRSAIKEILKFDITKENPTDPIVLPQADCVITMWILDSTSTNEDEYMTTLRKMMKFVKPGGLLLVIATVNGTYYKVGEDTMHVFQHDENFVKNAVTKEGFTVTHCEVLKERSH